MLYLFRTAGVSRGEQESSATLGLGSSTGKKAEQDEHKEEKPPRSSAPLLGPSRDWKIPVSQIISEFIARHFPHVTSRAAAHQSQSTREEPATVKEEEETRSSESDARKMPAALSSEAAAASPPADGSPGAPSLPWMRSTNKPRPRH